MWEVVCLWLGLLFGAMIGLNVPALQSEARAPVKDKEAANDNAD